MKTYELPNIGDARKSFYRKAVVVEDEDGKHLISYCSNICTIKPDGEVEIHTDIKNWDSPTSLRHLKSFLLFFDKESGSKKELLKMYCQTK
jgi:hypothetical protein